MVLVRVPRVPVLTVTVKKVVPPSRSPKKTVKVRIKRKMVVTVKRKKKR